MMKTFGVTVPTARITRFLVSCLGAIAVAALLTAPSTAGRHAPSTVYGDAIGDAGDAPDVAWVTVRPVAGGLTVDVALAGPTRLGPYGWILFGLDTDRNPYTGGGRGDELLLFVNGEGATFTRWTGGGFSPDFTHHDVKAALSGTDLTFVLSWADIGARSFNFSVASLRENADLAPGFGIAAYPRRRTARPRTHTAHLHRPRAEAQRFGLRQEKQPVTLASGPSLRGPLALRLAGEGVQDVGVDRRVLALHP